MTKAGALKLAGIFFGSLLLLTAGFFFAYPHINEERYNEIIENFRDDDVIDAMFEGDRRYIGIEFNELIDQIEKLRAEESTWSARFDSLNAVNSRLISDIEALTERKEELANVKEELALRASEEGNEYSALDVNSNETPEDISERVKSLMNLDEEELAPIVNQLSNEHLVRIYRNAGNMQREKLLRSLNPERAAEIVREIML
jgi:seryl-tRNA synthetase